MHLEHFKKWCLSFQCVKISIKDKQIKYFIHYSGWNKKWASALNNFINFGVAVSQVQSFFFFFFGSWDEWVPESRVLKYVESNLQKQKELQRANQYVQHRALTAFIGVRYF